jgi:hypothetical protein
MADIFVGVDVQAVGGCLSSQSGEEPTAQISRRGEITRRTMAFRTLKGPFVDEKYEPQSGAVFWMISLLDTIECARVRARRHTLAVNGESRHRFSLQVNLEIVK